MNVANTAVAIVDEPPSEPSGPAAVLRGTARGLEMFVDARAAADAIVAALEQRLAEAPAFFRGSNVRVQVDHGPLAAGCLTRLDELAQKYALHILEVAAKRAEPDAVPRPNLAAGSAPSPSTSFADEEPTHTAAAAMIAVAELERAFEESAPVTLETTALTELVEPPPDPDAVVPDGPDGLDAIDPPTERGGAPMRLASIAEDALEPAEGTRIVVGPVRSGVILDHVGHLFVFGDVNPGAEVRATGNIVVLGRLRGTAHAGIGQDVGFILALRLEPQQLRIGKLVTRAADAATPVHDAEIAYASGGTIIVESYVGKLPRTLATSL